MAKWYYDPYNNGENPLCYDLGKIEKIVFECNPKEYRTWIKCIVADGKRFNSWGEKKYMPLVSGWGFIANGQKTLILETEPESFSCLDFDGYFDMEIKGDSRSFNPVCCDPRFLYFLDRNWELILGFSPESLKMSDLEYKIKKANKDNDNKTLAKLENELTEYRVKVWTEFASFIPSMEYALNWLKERGYPSEPCCFQGREWIENYEKFQSGEWKYAYRSYNTMRY